MTDHEALAAVWIVYGIESHVRADVISVHASEEGAQAAADAYSDNDQARRQDNHDTVAVSRQQVLS